MIEIELQVVDPAEDVADKLARRLRADLAEIDGIAEAALARRPAPAGERGFVEDIGKLVVKVTTGAGAEAVLGAVKSMLRSGDREIVVKLPSGAVISLKGGGVSEAQFGKATEELVALFARSAGK